MYMRHVLLACSFLGSTIVSSDYVCYLTGTHDNSHIAVHRRPTLGVFQSNLQGSVRYRAA
jgi:hypothetical protein